MKKIFLLTFLAGIAIVSSCKKKANTDDEDNNNTNNNTTTDPCTMVITSDHGAATGDLFLLGTDNSFNDSTLFKKTGSNQTWDFSSLVSSQQDTFEFNATAGNPLAVLFPSANMIISTQGFELAAVKSSTGIAIIASELPPIIDNIAITPFFTDPATFIPYPLEKGASFNDSYSAGATMPYDTVIAFLGLTIDSVRATLTGSNGFSVDGCGKITTPSGTYDCIKYVVTPGTLNEKYEARANGIWLDFTTMIKALPGFSTPEIPLINSKSYV